MESVEIQARAAKDLLGERSPLIPGGNHLDNQSCGPSQVAIGGQLDDQGCFLRHEIEGSEVSGDVGYRISILEWVPLSGGRVAVLGIDL